METITARAEQAVLGALLSRSSGKPVAGLDADSFSDPRHQAIYGALTGTGPQPSGPLGRLWAWIAALPWRRQVRDMHAYLAQLPAACPDPANVDHYAAIVLEASRQRGSATHASDEGTAHDLNRLAGAAAWLASQSTPTTASAAQQPAQLKAIAQAVYQRSGAAPRVAATASAPQPVSGEAGKRDADPQPVGDQNGRGTTAERPLRSADLEELVLAGLLRHLDEAASVLGWLTADAFTGARREMYELIRTVVSNDLPADPLVVAWQARQTPAADAVLRIAAIPAAPGTASALGRALLADRVCTVWFGRDWPERRAAMDRDAVRDLRPAPASADQDASPEQALPDLSTSVGPISDAETGHERPMTSRPLRPSHAGLEGSPIVVPPPVPGEIPPEHRWPEPSSAPAPRL